MKSKDILFIACAVFLVSLSVLILVSANGLHNLSKEKRANYVRLAEDVMELVFDEGYSEMEIDYQDKILNQRQIFLIKNINNKNITEVILKLAYLDQTAPGELIDLYVDSSGGSAGWTLTNFFRSMESPVNVYAMDWCMSACAIILSGATGKSYAFPNSRITIHINPYTKEDIEEEDDEQFNYFIKFNAVSENFWKQSARLPDRFFPFDVERYYSLSVQDALEFEVIDEIITSK